MQHYRYAFKAMGSPCELQLYASSSEMAENAFTKARACIDVLERRYSRYREDSLTTEINAAAGRQAITVDSETAGLLDYAEQAYQQSGGLFDITSGILRNAWDFKSGVLPSQEQLNALLPLVDWSSVEWQAPTIRLPQAGMQIDFGGYVKEYAVDAAVKSCLDMGIEHGLLDMGGDLGVIGPHPDGQPWQVGIRHPRDPAQPLATIALASGGLASSGDYERFMDINGQRYCHILNPQTGWPVTGFAAVTVVAEQTLIAGSLSTIAMLKGKDEGADWLETLGLPHLWVTPDLEVGGSLAV